MPSAVAGRVLSVEELRAEPKLADFGGDVLILYGDTPLIEAVTMARMDRLFGVTMVEKGVSQLVSVDLQGAVQLRKTAA